MGFTYNSQNQTWHADDIADLTVTVMNNFMQYGQPYHPNSPNFDHDIYNNNDSVIQTVQVDQQSVMLNGYGSGISADDFPIVNKLINSSVNLANGSYSFDDLLNLGLVTGGDRKIEANAYWSGLDTGNISTSTAAYVHGSVGFALMDDTRFIVQNGKIVEIQAEIGALDDNFDFNSDNSLVNLINGLVFVAAGPDFMPAGAKVILVYRGDGKISVVKGDVTVNDINQCFPADTKILLADGTEKPISDITTADKVAAFHPSNFAGRGGLEGKQVVRLFENITDVWVQLSNGMTVTPGHHFLDAKGNFRTISDILKTDSQIVLADGTLAKVTGEYIHYNEETADMFEQAEGYFAQPAADGLSCPRPYSQKGLENI